MERFNSKALTSAINKAVSETSYTLKGTSYSSEREVIPAILHEPYGELRSQFVPFIEAFQLKQLGFDEECFGAWIKDSRHPSMGYYRDQVMADLSNGCLAPLWEQAFDFFFKKYKLSSFRRQSKSLAPTEHILYWWTIKILETEKEIKGYSNHSINLEMSKLDCLRKLIDLAENGY
jgi:hypothetical protein